MKWEARGVSGELRKGYQIVARLHDGTLEADNGQYVASRASDVNTFWLDDPEGLELHLTLGSRVWVWREVHILDVGPPFAVRAIGSPDVR